MDIAELNGVLKKAFRQECQLVDDSHLFYKIEFPNQFNVNEFEEFAENCEKFLSQYDIKTGATSIRYSKESQKLYVLRINKLPLEKFLEKLAVLNKDLKLHEAILMRDADQNIQELLSQGAEVNSRNIDGETPLFSAVYAANLSVVEFFLSKGAKVNHQNFNGTTALIMAVMLAAELEVSKILPVVNVLLNYGADVTIVTKENESALQMANQSNNTEVGSTLIDTLLIKDLMATKPCFLNDKLSFYWDKTVQKMHNKFSLQKVSDMEEGKTIVHKVEKSPSFAANGAIFFNGTGEYKQAEERQTIRLFK